VQKTKTIHPLLTITMETARQGKARDRREYYFTIKRQISTYRDKQAKENRTKRDPLNPSIKKLSTRECSAPAPIFS
jgi:hypothetical protein